MEGALSPSGPRGEKRDHSKDQEEELRDAESCGADVGYLYCFPERYDSAYGCRDLRTSRDLRLW